VDAYPELSRDRSRIVWQLIELNSRKRYSQTYPQLHA